jgi:hydroxyacylglutathione hydrolase
MRQSQTTNKIFIKAINAFNDNYIWVISSSANNNVILVDPGDSNCCIGYLEKNNYQLSAILLTHHHADHTGGVNNLVEYSLKKNNPIEVYGPKNEVTPCSIRVSEGDKVIIDALNIEFDVLDIPGHTLGHIAFISDDKLFCGDTLFSAGCGRIFEGTAPQMFKSIEKLLALPDKTQIYCAHEYTSANLAFAITVDPNNLELIDYYNHVKVLTEQGKSTLPTSLLREKSINPFLRCTNLEIKQSAEEFSNQSLNSPCEVFTKIRQLKDQF